MNSPLSSLAKSPFQGTKADDITAKDDSLRREASIREDAKIIIQIIMKRHASKQ
jgi:hypothetical protein